MRKLVKSTIATVKAQYLFYPPELDNLWHESSRLQWRIIGNKPKMHRVDIRTISNNILYNE